MPKFFSSTSKVTANLQKEAAVSLSNDNSKVTGDKKKKIADYNDAQVIVTKGKILGKGVTAKVKAYTYQSGDKTIQLAVKKYSSNNNLAKSVAASERAILKELKELRAPYVIGFLDIQLTFNKPYIVMELAYNGTLNKLLSEKRKELSVSSQIEAWWVKGVDIAFKIAIGIQFLHKYHITHGDLKTKNILLIENNEPRIADFGFAQKVDEHTGRGQRAYEGSPLYTAPEILMASERKEVDSKAGDVYAFSLLLFETVTLRKAFATYAYASLEEFQDVVGSGEEPGSLKELPLYLAKTIRFGWAKKSERATADQMVKNLEESASQLGVRLR